jgi:hypothetical protein
MVKNNSIRKEQRSWQLLEERWQLREASWHLREKNNSNISRRDDNLICASKPLEMMEDPLFPKDVFTEDQQREEIILT